MRPAPDANQVAHAPRGHKQRRFLAKHLRRALLQPVDRGILAVNVVAHFCRSHGATHFLARPRHRIAAQVHHAFRWRNVIRVHHLIPFCHCVGHLTAPWVVFWVSNFVTRDSSSLNSSPHTKKLSFRSERPGFFLRARFWRAGPRSAVCAPRALRRGGGIPLWSQPLHNAPHRNNSTITFPKPCHPACPL